MQSVVRRPVKKSHRVAVEHACNKTEIVLRFRTAPRNYNQYIFDVEIIVLIRAAKDFRCIFDEYLWLLEPLSFTWSSCASMAAHFLRRIAHPLPFPFESVSENILAS